MLVFLLDGLEAQILDNIIQVGVLELCGIFRITLNVLYPVTGLLTETLDLEVRVIRVFKINQALVWSVKEHLPQLHASEIVDLISGCDLK